MRKDSWYSRITQPHAIRQSSYNVLTQRMLCLQSAILLHILRSVFSWITREKAPPGGIQDWSSALFESQKPPPRTYKPVPAAAAIAPLHSPAWSVPLSWRLSAGPGIPCLFLRISWCPFYGGSMGAVWGQMQKLSQHIQITQDHDKTMTKRPNWKASYTKHYTIPRIPRRNCKVNIKCSFDQWICQ